MKSRSSNRFPPRARRRLVGIASILPTGLAWLAAVGLAAGSRAAAAEPATVVLISLDGTRPADVRPDWLPALVDLGRRGAHAEALVPVNPSNTFPNHASLATGVHPDRHGIVNNEFDDPERGGFDEDAIYEWIESEPIWSIAERSGLPTASFYWVGSEGPWRGGPAPRETRAFSSRTLEKTKVDQILRWLAREDANERPRLVLSWFRGGDHAGHADGPGAPSVGRALRSQDRELARLVAGMEARGLFASTTLIVVSDHGMARAERRINLNQVLRKHGLRAKAIGIGGFSSIVAGPTRRRPRDLERIVDVVRAAGLEAHRREQAPADWHVDHPRFGHVVVRAPQGTAIVTPSTRILGFHGYDPRSPEMAALLVARGRGVRPGASLGRVSSLAVAPTVLTLLGLPVPEQMTEPPIAALTQLGAGAGEERGTGVEAVGSQATGGGR